MAISVLDCHNKSFNKSSAGDNLCWPQQQLSNLCFQPCTKPRNNRLFASSYGCFPISAKNDLQIFGFSAKNKRFLHSPFVEQEKLNLPPYHYAFFQSRKFFYVSQNSCRSIQPAELFEPNANKFKYTRESSFKTLVKIWMECAHRKFVKYNFKVAHFTHHKTDRDRGLNLS